jgi:hypothetical protein
MQSVELFKPCHGLGKILSQGKPGKGFYFSFQTPLSGLIVIVQNRAVLLGDFPFHIDIAKPEFGKKPGFCISYPSDTTLGTNAAFHVVQSSKASEFDILKKIQSIAQPRNGKGTKRFLRKGFHVTSLPSPHGPEEPTHIVSLRKGVFYLHPRCEKIPGHLFDGYRMRKSACRSPQGRMHHGDFCRAGHHEAESRIGIFCLPKLGSHLQRVFCRNQPADELGAANLDEPDYGGTVNGDHGKLFGRCLLKVLGNGIGHHVESQRHFLGGHTNFEVFQGMVYQGRFPIGGKLSMKSGIRNECRTFMRTQKSPIVFIHAESLFLARSKAFTAVDAKLGNHVYHAVNNPDRFSGTGFYAIHASFAEIVVSLNPFKRNMIVLHDSKPHF